MHTHTYTDKLRLIAYSLLNNHRVPLFPDYVRRIHCRQDQEGIMSLECTHMYTYRPNSVMDIQKEFINILS